jgi:AcrR family transcriptional regulator
MPRTIGAKAKDHDAKRAELLDHVGAHLRKSLSQKPSLRELANACGVTLPTLRHYFGNRDGVIAAYFEHFGSQGAPHLAIVAACSLPFEPSMRALVAYILAGLVHARVIDGHAAGLSEAVGSEGLGPAYLIHLLEPTLQAVEQRLKAHQTKGEMRASDTRIAALMLVSPLFLAALHQTSLGGCAVRPMDIEALSKEVVDTFVRAYGASRFANE